MQNLSFSLEGKIALVTGASSGIGREVAKGLAESGATVVAAARRADKLKDLVAEIEAAGSKAIAVNMDVTSRDSVNAAFAEVEKQLGVVEILVNNAGVADPKNFLRTDESSRDFVMGANFNGVWNVAQEAAQRMVDAGKPGSIINIASILALGVQAGQSAYSASKGAVAQLTRNMAIDLMKHNIRVNAIAPGWFKTEMNQDYFNSPEGEAYIQRMPARRLGQPSELVGPIILLASEAGSFLNGAVLPVDGAISVVMI